MFTIEKNIPFTPALNERSSKYPYRALEVGDSFFIPNKTAKQMYSQVYGWSRKTHFVLRLRDEANGVRLYRVA